MPAMRAVWAGRYVSTSGIVTGIGNDLWNSCDGIHFTRPCCFNPRLGRDELSCFTIDHVKKSILGRMHQYLCVFTLNFDRGQHDIHVRIIIPCVAWRGLVMPFIGTVIGIECHNGREKEIVAAIFASDLWIPWASISGSDVKGM